MGVTDAGRDTLDTDACSLPLHGVMSTGKGKPFPDGSPSANKVSSRVGELMTVEEQLAFPTKEEMLEAYKEVLRERLGGIGGSDGRRRESHNRSKGDVVSADAYKGSPKWLAIERYLDSVGHPISFMKLIEAMRAGGMELPTPDGQAFRILGIVVKQNAGPDGKRDWPTRFYREGLGDIFDKVGLLSWKKDKTK